MSNNPYQAPAHSGPVETDEKPRRNFIGVLGLTISLSSSVAGVVVTVRYVLDEVLHHLRSDPESVFMLFLVFFGLNVLGFFVSLPGLIWTPRRYSLYGLCLAPINLVWQVVLVFDSLGRM